MAGKNNLADTKKFELSGKHRQPVVIDRKKQLSRLPSNNNEFLVDS